MTDTTTTPPAEVAVVYDDASVYDWGDRYQWASLDRELEEAGVRLTARRVKGEVFAEGCDMVQPLTEVHYSPVRWAVEVSRGETARGETIWTAASGEADWKQVANALIASHYGSDRYINNYLYWND